MLEWLGWVVVAFGALFVVVEPLGLVPLFLSLTKGRSPREVAAIARRAVLVGAGVLVAFTLVGRLLLDVLGIQLDAFRAAGGLLLALTALDMLRGKPAHASPCRCSSRELEPEGDARDVAIVPLAMPLLTGPGAMGTVLALIARDGGGPPVTLAVLVAIGLVFLVSWLVLRAASVVQRALGQATLTVLARVFGLFLAAIAVQMVVAGVRGLWA
ncbi:MAG: MarC family protein [Deltaproteobacteria bacterium]|nr:MarC family protein [Deltaproteobacteria bacterium]